MLQLPNFMIIRLWIFMIEGSQKEINIHNPYKSVATVLLRFSSFLFLSAVGWQLQNKSVFLLPFSLLVFSGIAGTIFSGLTDREKNCLLWLVRVLVVLITILLVWMVRTLLVLLTDCLEWLIRTDCNFVGSIPSITGTLLFLGYASCRNDQNDLQVNFKVQIPFHSLT